MHDAGVKFASVITPKLFDKFNYQLYQWQNMGNKNFNLGVWTLLTDTES